MSGYRQQVAARNDSHEPDAEGHLAPFAGRDVAEADRVAVTGAVVDAFEPEFSRQLERDAHVASAVGAFVDEDEPAAAQPLEAQRFMAVGDQPRRREREPRPGVDHVQAGAEFDAGDLRAHQRRMQTELGLVFDHAGHPAVDAQ